MGWDAVNADSVVASMSTALAHAYDMWLVEVPAKSGRLAVVVGQVLAEWRDALTKEGAETLDPDTGTVPTRVVKHVEACAHWYIALEMNATGAAVNGVLGFESLEVPEGGTAVNVNAVSPQDGLSAAFKRAQVVLDGLKRGPGRSGSPSIGSAAAVAERALR